MRHMVASCDLLIKSNWDPKRIVICFFSIICLVHLCNLVRVVLGSFAGRYACLEQKMSAIPQSFTLCFGKI